MLHRTIRIQSAGNTLSDIGMTFHIIEEELECSWLERHVAVDDKMILGSGLADCLIMSCTIAHIVDTIINDTNRRHKRRLLQTGDATVEFTLWRMVCDNGSRDHNCEVRALQRLSSGTGASIIVSTLDTGCTKLTLRE